MTKKSQRLDERLVQLGLATDLRQASALVMEGRVIVDDQRVDKPSTPVADLSSIRLKATKQKSKQFVSRGGDKLYEAVESFQLIGQFEGSSIVDVGSSTGGFTDCVLQLGAKRVLCIDVGLNQLHFSLRRDPRVETRESTDVRSISRKDICFEHIDWICADLSFISAQSYIESLSSLMDQNTRLLLLVKPQFETPRADIPEGGVIDAPDQIEHALERVRLFVQARENLKLVGEHRLSVHGAKGNKEAFFLISKS